MKHGKRWKDPPTSSLSFLSQNNNDQVREIVYTANGEKITNEDSPLRNSDLVQLVGFTTYSNTLGDDGYELLLSRNRKLSIY